MYFPAISRNTLRGSRVEASRAGMMAMALREVVMEYCRFPDEKFYRNGRPSARLRVNSGRKRKTDIAADFADEREIKQELKRNWERCLVEVLLVDSRSFA